MKYFIVLVLAIVGVASAYLLCSMEKKPSAASVPSNSVEVAAVATAPSVLQAPARVNAAPQPAEDVPATLATPPPQSLATSMASLKGLIVKLPDLQDVEVSLQEKYRGMGAEDLLSLYPMLRMVHRQEMYDTLHSAIDSGRYVSEIVPDGQPVDWNKYTPEGVAFPTIAHRTQPLGNGLTEYQIVSIDRTNFPEMFARCYEEYWVHSIIDEAGICTVCNTMTVSRGR